MEIELAETVEALRDELRKAVLAAEDVDIQFPVTGVQVEFHIGVKKTADGKAGIKFWLVELGGASGYASERSRR